MKNQNRSIGMGAFTLIEFLVVIALIALLIVGGFAILGQLLWVLGVIIWAMVQCLPLIFIIVVSMAAWTGIQNLWGPRPPKE